jgi:type III restriction enzyme
VVRSEGIDNPILNSPYEPPAAHFELGPDGPTGTVLEGRRPSESFIPVPRARKGREQGTLDFDPTGERREQNTLINDIRFEVERWRARGYPGATPITRKLVQHWSAKPPEREEPAFFCQREAAETAIFLVEVAGRHGYADYRTRIDPENAAHNDGLPRVALKMATATGKTVVMAMLIAWHTANKVATPNDARFSKRFLVVTPGITIRERLRVLEPADGHSFRARDAFIVILDATNSSDGARSVESYQASYQPPTGSAIQAGSALGLTGDIQPGVTATLQLVFPGTPEPGGTVAIPMRSGPPDYSDGNATIPLS